MTEGRGSRTVLWVVLIVAAVFLLLWLFRVIDFSAKGGDMPEVQVEGGALPDVDADVADVAVGSENVTMEVPTIDTEQANAEAENN